MDIKFLYEKLINGEIDIEDLSMYKTDCIKYATGILNTNKIDYKELDFFLRLCLDYYYYSISGDVLISDSMYDACMNTYIANGNDRIIYPDTLKISATQWEIKKHEVPGLVGSLNKIYEYDELKDYFNNKLGKLQSIILAPKYDGISIALKITNGKIEYALTRYDGFNGQDIKAVIQNANLKQVKKYGKDGYYKCEVVVSNESFEELQKIKSYTNRRSATSGICSSPKNIAYGKYLTVLPLLYYDGNSVEYIAKHSKLYTFYHARDIHSTIEALLDEYKNPEFKYRVDGVVLYPVFDYNRINKDDFLDDAIAFKINTSKAVAKVKYAYFSIGRLGNAIPMLKIEPTEINETIVEDVSAGSYRNFKTMELYEGENVLVYSAGDVIPQVAPLENRYNVYNKDELKIDKHCPYCGHKLTRVTTEYKCENSNCIRIISGRISNFVDKMGILGISDKTIEALVDAKLLSNIADLFKLKYHKDEMLALEGFSHKSVNTILDDIEYLSETPFNISKIIGSLGIELISEKKARKIFDTISIRNVLDKKPKKVINTILASDGIGHKTAEIFVEFIDENRDMIKEILSNMKAIDNVSYYGSIVFSGFRNPDLAKKFENIGIEVSNNVTNRTLALLTTDLSRNTEKCKQAMKKDISIYNLDEEDILYNNLRRYIKDNY